MKTGSVSISFPATGVVLEAERGNNLLEVIRKAGITLNADCGGVGRCGKCRVLVNGIAQLACLTNVIDDIEAYIPGSDKDKEYEILTDHQGYRVVEVDPTTVVEKTVAEATSAKTYSLAIDIGTTTVVGKLLHSTAGIEIASFAQLNEQIVYGADVISRIDISTEDSSQLCGLITKQIDLALSQMLVEQGIGPSAIDQVVIAGNTTMSYLLLNLPCRSLSMAPFQPEYPIDSPYSYDRVFGKPTLRCTVDVLPYISAFVGGDLTAGLCTLQEEDDFILMDIGTNGELIFKRGERLICTATAAGPAFEGGNIECGSGSTKGAISQISYQDSVFSYRTIGDLPATGICGSGILDLMAALVKSGFVDSSGFLSEDFDNARVILALGSETTGGEDVYFSQKDVRQFQLAKSAIRTGLDVLMSEMGGEPPARVFLAGGFGQNLNPQSAITVGLLPQMFAGRIVPIGNSSLSGAVKICLDPQARQEVIQLIERGQEINLASHRLFSDLFMENMYF